MRILLFSGKGGVGKTSLAAATGLQLANLGRRTLVMSIDPAHSLADSFDLDTDLFHSQTSDPLAINDRLSILELNIQKEVKRHWQEISSYVTSVLRTTGISDVEADELAILPGMEELSAMMYINQYRRENRYDVVVLDAAPTADSMRFISMPTSCTEPLEFAATVDSWLGAHAELIGNLLGDFFRDLQRRRAAAS